MLMSWFRALLPREERFFDLFNRHAQTLVAGAALPPSSAWSR